MRAAPPMAAAVASIRANLRTMVNPPVSNLESGPLSAMSPLKPTCAEPPVCGEFIADLCMLSFVHIRSVAAGLVPADAEPSPYAAAAGIPAGAILPRDQP